ncbi:MAG: fasciclin domain-containing protein [bacterium]
MKFKSYTLMIAALLMVSMIGIGYSDDDNNNPIANNAPTMDIVETAAAAGNFTTLLAAAEEAGLVDALKSEGPFTVFAPTDEAFAKLPEGAVEALLEDKDKLASILTYHVVEGAVDAGKVVKLDKAETLNGQSVTILVLEGKVMIDNAQVTMTDIICSNGIIHIIDNVILPQ